MNRARTWLATLLCALAAVAPAAGAAEQKATPSPAARYVIEKVTSRATPKAGALQGTMKLRIRHLAKEETLARLVSGNVAITSASVKDGGLLRRKPFLMRLGDQVGILLKRCETAEVELEFATPIHTVDAVQSARIPTANALSAVYEVSLPGENLNVTVQPELPVQKETGGGQTVVRIHGAGAADVVLTWEPAPEERALETIAFAEQRATLSLSRGVARVETEINYSLLQGKMSTAVIRLPEGYSLLSVKCANMRTWRMSDDPERKGELELALADQGASQTRVALVLEKTLGPVPLTFEAPDLVALGVARQKGTFLVALEKGLQAEIVERSNIGQVDLATLTSISVPDQQKPVLALAYLSRPYGVKLRISTVKPKVYGEVSCLTVASVERLRQNWDVRYEIRNAGLFQLKLKLAPGMKLVSLRGDNINNQNLDAESNILTIDLRSKAEGGYGLNVQTYSEIEDPQHVPLPALELLGVERQWGAVAISANSGVAVETQAMSGISQIDVGELKSIKPLQRMIQEQRAGEPVLGFRYLSFPYELALNVSHIRPELKAQCQHYIEITRKNLRYHSVFDYRIKKAGVFQIQLHVPSVLRGNMVISGPKVEDYSYDAASETLTVQLTEKTVNELTIEFESETLLSKELPPPGESDKLPIPIIHTVGTEQERGYVAVGTDESIRLKRTGTAGGLHDVDVQETPPSLLRRAGNAKLAFRVIRSPWELELEVTSIPPKIQAQTFNYIRFGEDYLVGAATIDFDIQYAGVKEFLVRLPAGITKPNIKGKNIKIQEKVEEKPAPGEAEPQGQLWRVELQSEVKGSYQLIFEYTKELKADETRRQFIGPKVVGEMAEVEREIGYLAVTGDPSLELTPVADEIVNLTPVDEQEIPVKFRKLPASVAEQIGRETVPILFAFRYLGHPYQLVISAVKHEEADVVTAVVETCKLDTTLTKEGSRITTLVADVRSRYQSFLEIELPQDARLWSALVNGKGVRPLIDEANKAKNVTKIPIARAQGVKGPVRVELQWEELNGDALGWMQNVKLKVPSLRGVRILRLGWVLQLPRGYHVISSSGTLEQLPGAGYFEDSLRQLKPTGELSRAGSVAGQTIEKHANQQVLSNAMVMQARTTGKRGSQPGSAFAARKPVLPEHFYFQSLILNPREPAMARMTCVRGSARTLLLAGVVLVILGLCAGLWRLSGPAITTRAPALIILLGVFGGLRVIAEQDYAELLTAALLTVAVATAALILSAGVGWLSRRRAPEKA